MNITEIPENSILFVDLDNTIVFSNEANNLAYKQALSNTPYGIWIYNHIVQETQHLQKTLRITEKDIWQSCEMLHSYIKANKHPEINYSELERIITLAINNKKEIYSQFLSITKPNTKLINYLNNTKSIKILVTKASEQRAVEILHYHGIFSLFQEHIFCPKEYFKYKYAIEHLFNNSIILDNFLLDQFYIFDDDLEEITSVIEYGVPKENTFIL